ncbi:MAG: AgmX/PglI C-terminal domain-containing protein [Pseudomonadota bacterium]
MLTTRTIAPVAMLTLLAGCIPPPADIGVDYSGPIYRKPGAEAARVVTNAPVLPVSQSDCVPVTEVPTRKRSECGVKLVMARYNPGLQTLYQRRLAEDASLKGNVVLRLIIAPDGSVQAADIASSDIHDAEFTRQVVAYVRTIGFGALEAVPAWSDTYTVEFTPPKDLIPLKPATPAPARAAEALVIADSDITGVRRNAEGGLERTPDGIRAIMGHNNGALQAIWQDALRSKPALKGAVVFRLVVEPDGSVSTAEIVSSELADPETEQKLAARIKAIKFGSIKDVLPWDDKYTVSFPPK